MENLLAEPAAEQVQPSTVETPAATIQNTVETVNAGTLDFGSLTGEDGNFRRDVNWSEVLAPLGETVSKQAGTIAKYRNPTELVKGFAHSIALAGKKAEGVIIPNEESDEQAWADYRKAVGAPETPDGYNLTREALGIPDNAPFSEESAKEYASIMHKHGASPALVKDLMAAYAKEGMDGMEAAQAQQQEAGEAYAKRTREELREAWGANQVEQKTAMVRKACLKLGMPDDTTQWSLSTVMKALANAAELLGEDRLPDTPAEHAMDIEAQIQEMANNPQYQSGSQIHVKKMQALVRQKLQLSQRAR